MYCQQFPFSFNQHFSGLFSSHSVKVAQSLQCILSRHLFFSYSLLLGSFFSIFFLFYEVFYDIYSMSSMRAIWQSFFFLFNILIIFWLQSPNYSFILRFLLCINNIVYFSILAFISLHRLKIITKMYLSCRWLIDNYWPKTLEGD